MSKKQKSASAAVENPTETLAAEAAKVSIPKTRGPRGTEESAKITVLAATNPKRPGSKAFDVFAKYRSGMTIKEFCDEVGKEATGHLVYDAKHGSIAIEGYDPGAIITPKPKTVKEPKAKKEKAVKAEQSAEAEALAAETQTETME
jgi:hypothetical protein